MTPTPILAPTLTDADTLLLYALELAEDHPPQCEGQAHRRGILGHDPTAPAAYWVLSPCHPRAIAQCATRVAKFRRDGLLRCGVCHTEYVIERFRLVPIEDAHL